MSSIFDSMIPSRRREQRRLRDEANRLHERFGDSHITAPLEGCWNATEQTTPDLTWPSPSPSPSTQGYASPGVASARVNNSPELGDFGEPVIIVDTDIDPSVQVYHEEPEKNAFTVTIPLPWPSRKTASRSPLLSQGTESAINAPQQAWPRPSAAPVSVVYKPTSEQYMKELGGMSRGNSPVQPVLSSGRHASPDLPFAQPNAMSSFAKRSPPPPLDQEEVSHKISAIMLLSPVAEDFHPRPSTRSTFSRAGSHGNITHFTPQLPSPQPERPSTAMSSHSTVARSETGTAVSKVTAITDISYHTALTHPTIRSSSRGPVLAHTGSMRSASREPGPRRALSREPSERQVVSPYPGSRRAVSREPPRQRALTAESALYRRQSLEDLRQGASSRSGRTSIQSDYSDEPSVSEGARKAPSSSAANGGYYASMADEYRHIAWDASIPSSSESDSLVGRVGKAAKEKFRPKEPSPALPSKELVPAGEDLYS